MKFNDMSAVFGVEKDKGKLDGIIKQIISNEALVAVTILTAESNPDEMEIVVKLITNLLQ